MALRYSRLLASSSTMRIDRALTSGRHADRFVAGVIGGARALHHVAGAIVAQLGDGAQLELAHALAADAELLAQRPQRRRARAHVARLEDGALARVELL